MASKPTEVESEPVTRRGFLASGAVSAGVLIAAGAERAQAAEAPSASSAPLAPVNCAVIGLGQQGRDIVAALGRLPGGNVVAVCDTYQPFLNRAKEGAPKATPVPDYHQVLDRKDVQAVFIATPSHKHREIAIAAIGAGKHVYCEAPLAHTIEEAKAIALAGKAAPSGQIFQVGLQYRGNPQHHHVLKFVETGVLATLVAGRGQWHKKTSWRRAAPTPQREQEMNWRLNRETAAGLMGEVGIHSLDVANWFLKELPVAVHGSGGVMNWKDGRDVPDTVQCVVEYPGGVRFTYDATLANSFDGTYELFLGSEAAVLMRDQRAWMFREADSPLLGWVVYARKEPVGDETGIALVADATKQIKEGKLPGQEKIDAGKNALYYSVESFLNSVRDKTKPTAGPLEGYQAVVTAVKANEAILSGTRVAYQKEWFDL